MTYRSFVRISLSALLFGGLTAGCSLHGGGVASAGSREAGYARQAEQALARHDPGAVALAEAAVLGAPTRADYRLVLARAYLAAGRFESARTAFGDVMTLDPANGRAALNLALAQIACGDPAAARGTLETYGQVIVPADLGLALALSGDPAAAVRLLMDAARRPGADARVRQNLALSLGLSGQWPMARAVAAVDLSPADLDARIIEWIAFAQPQGKADQVAALLGVPAAGQDLGQPAALALAAPAPAATALAAAAEAPLGTVLAVQAVPPVQTAKIVFGPRREVVQPLPATRVAMADGAARKRF